MKAASPTEICDFLTKEYKEEGFEVQHNFTNSVELGTKRPVILDHYRLIDAETKETAFHTFSGFDRVINFMAGYRFAKKNK